MRTFRLIAGLVVGCLTAVALAGACFWVLRISWPEYAAAEPEKAYTLGMLFARLGIAAFLTVGAAWMATVVAGDNGRAAWCLGGFFVLVSLPSHLYYVWDDYPVWYHALYLAYLVPVAGYSARLFRALLPASPAVGSGA
jgi:hypothetical protein